MAFISGTIKTILHFWEFSRRTKKTTKDFLRSRGVIVESAEGGRINRRVIGAHTVDRGGGRGLSAAP